MSRIKATSNGPQAETANDQENRINPFDAIVATLDGETMGRPRIQLLASGRSASTIAPKPRPKKAA